MLLLKINSKMKVRRKLNPMLHGKWFSKRLQTLMLKTGAVKISQMKNINQSIGLMAITERDGRLISPLPKEPGLSPTKQAYQMN